ncbi:HEAT repeat domain-containing protein [candidate division WOR-3 bacterium]|nr:HEAT repeat domain-containing protein [candidate division WOR-3 bacterium]
MVYKGRAVETLAKAIIITLAVFLCLPSVVYSETEDVKTLIRKLDNDDVRVREEAAQALGETKDPRAIKPLINTMKKDEYWDVRKAAAQSLGELGNPAAVNPLLNVLKKDDNRNVQGAAASALGEIGDTKAVEPLIEALDNKSSEVRKEAAKALGMIGDTTAVGPLILALKDDDSRVRQNSAYALGELAITYNTVSMRGSDSTVTTMVEHPRATGTLGTAIESEDLDVVAGAYAYYIRKGEDGTEDLLEKAIYIYGTREMAVDYLNSGNLQLEEAARYWAESRSATLPTDTKKGPKWGEYEK